MILQCLKEVKIATLYAKSMSIIQPDYFEKETSRWIVFSWDIKETIRNIAEKQKGKPEVNKEIAKLLKAGLPKNLTQKFLNEIK